MCGGLRGGGDRQSVHSTLAGGTSCRFLDAACHDAGFLQRLCGAVARRSDAFLFDRYQSVLGGRGHAALPVGALGAGGSRYRRQRYADVAQCDGSDRDSDRRRGSRAFRHAGDGEALYASRDPDRRGGGNICPANHPV
ncbi:hypothetical protein D3C80_1595650 [compost metagenome]